MHILVVDDYANAADSLAEMLSDLGHTVSVAYSGADALQSLRDQPPQLALLDINLPDLDGWDIARALREAGASCYIVAMTATTVPTYVVRSARAGCDLHLTKPIDPADLERAIAIAGTRGPGAQRAHVGAGTRSATGH